MSRLKKMSILTAALFGLAGAVSTAKEQPNFLFVMVDDMAPDAIFHDRVDFWRHRISSEWRMKVRCLIICL